MTIDEAIEILNNEWREHHSFPTDIKGRAMRLGIEALKLVKEARHAAELGYSRRLPVETEE